VLPFNWAGVALILFAFLLFALEMFITSHGVLGIGGIIALFSGDCC
jgi:membrane-bound serine protease (ClpP class)